MKPRVLITRKLPDVAAEILRARFDVEQIEQNAPLASQVLKEALRQYDALLTTVTDKLDRATLFGVASNDEGAAQGCRTKVISNYAVGLDNIDLETARSLGIRVYNTPDVVTHSTADLTFALLLTVVRRTEEFRPFIQSGQWKAWDPYLIIGEELWGKTFGIIGFGKIGQAVAQRAVGFGLNIVYSDVGVVEPHPSLRGLARAVSLDELYATSDYISVHAPLTPESRGFVDGAAFAKMRRQPVFMNMGRGPLVQTDALVHALKTGQIRGAALDVTDPEPLSAQHELAQIKNCLISPHIGTSTVECRANMAKLAAQNIVNHFFNSTLTEVSPGVSV